jgi:hypothetical protein
LNCAAAAGVITDSVPGAGCGGVGRTHSVQISIFRSPV